MNLRKFRVSERLSLKRLILGVKFHILEQNSTAIACIQSELNGNNVFGNRE